MVGGECAALRRHLNGPARPQVDVHDPPGADLSRGKRERDKTERVLRRHPGVPPYLFRPAALAEIQGLETL